MFMHCQSCFPVVESSALQMSFSQLILNSGKCVFVCCAFCPGYSSGALSKCVRLTSVMYKLNLLRLPTDPSLGFVAYIQQSQKHKSITSKHVVKADELEKFALK